MKIVLADYGGYPFTLQLAKRLSDRGHEVLYICRDASRLMDALQPGVETGGLRVVRLKGDGRMEKGNLLVRWSQERGFGRHAARLLRRERPDILVSANMPLDAQQVLAREARRHGAFFVYWLQDLIGTATRAILTRRLGLAGTLLGQYYVRLENRLLARSDTVIAISEAFLDTLKDRGVEPRRLAVVPNWSPLDELPLAAKDNPWSREHGWADRPVVMYSGSLGMKHHPGLLLDLARSLADSDHAEVVVVAEGTGARWLEEGAAASSVDNLHVLPFQDRRRLPQVLGTADVLVAMLESSAGSFSVPSKVLSYLCAGRPIVASVPEHNDVAKLLQETVSGLVCSPSDADALAATVHGLLRDPITRERMGRNARQYAEQTFDIDAITARFESIFRGMVA